MGRKCHLERHAICKHNWGSPVISARFNKSYSFFSPTTLPTLAISLSPSPPLVLPAVPFLRYHCSAITLRLIATMAAPAHSQGVYDKSGGVSTPSLMHTHESELQLPLATEPKEPKGKSRKADAPPHSKTPHQRFPSQSTADGTSEAMGETNSKDTGAASPPLPSQTPECIMAPNTREEPITTTAPSSSVATHVYTRNFSR